MTRILFNDGWSVRQKVTAFSELGGSSAADWTAVHLPHDALISTARTADAPRGETNGHFRGGAFEYRKTLHVEAERRGRHLTLEFDGIYRDAMVYVNGALAGQHALGYSRFHVRIDPYLDFDSDNEIRVECRTHLDSRWYAGAGIHRDVHLIEKSPTHIVIDSVQVSTPDIEPDRAVVEVRVGVANTGRVTTTQAVAVALLDHANAEVAATSSPITLLPGTDGVVRARMYVTNPALWDTDTPNLYRAEVTLTHGDVSVDNETVTFGIRSLQMDPAKGLRINGRPVELRGACIHSDNGPIGAVSMLAAELRRVAILKEAGFNAIRSAHNPLSSAMLDACDRLGMLVMDETFDVWTSAKSDFDYAFDFPVWWERDVEAMVAKDINHPSVIFYSIGNEIPETGNRFGAEWGRTLAEKVRSLDSSRYVTNGINAFVSMLDTIIPQMQARRAAAAEQPAGPAGVNGMMADFGRMMDAIHTSEQATTRTEESFAVLDVAGMNYADARYKLDREAFPDRLIIGTETYPTAIAGNWELVRSIPQVLGDFTWTGWDYIGETGIGALRYADQMGDGSTGFSGGFPELLAYCGDVDITGHRRPASYYREIVFGLRSDPYIAVGRPENFDRPVGIATPWAWFDVIGSWSWSGSEGSPIAVEVYSDADEVQLLLDGVELGRSRVGSTMAFRADFEVTFQPGRLTAVSYRDGTATGESSIASAADDIALTATADRLTLTDDGADLAYLTIEITDARGRVHATRDRAVTVTIDGPASLQGLGSANPSTSEAFSAASHDTFDGRAVAVVRPTGTGDITVTVTAADCTPAVVSLTADSSGGGSDHQIERVEEELAQ